jgi:hypothetical protein
VGAVVCYRCCARAACETRAELSPRHGAKVPSSSDD